MARYDYLNVGLVVMPSLDELLAASGSATQTTATLYERTVTGGTFAGFRIQFTGTDFAFYADGQPYSGTIQQISVLRPDGVVIERSTDYGALNRELARFPDAGYLLAEVPIYGSGSADHIVMHEGSVYAGAGNDTITGTASFIETLDVGDGDDFVSLTGSSVIPTLVGGTGRDVLEIAAGDVSTIDFSGFETLQFGAASASFFLGVANNAVLPAKLQVDATAGSSKATILITPNADDTSIDLSQWTFNSAALTQVSTKIVSNGDNHKPYNVIGSSVNDTISIEYFGSDSFGDVVASGRGGNDTFRIDRPGDYTLSGDAGDDIVQVSSEASGRIDGGDGMDIISFEHFYGGNGYLSITLNGDQEVVAGGVRIKNVEGIIGTPYHDTLIGDGLANTFRDSYGDDVLQGKGGKDTLDGGGGTDLADYSEKTAAVSVALNGRKAVSVKVGGVAEDILFNIENLNGGSGADVLTGDGANNVFSGGGGNDLLSGHGGHDQLTGGAGDDSLSGDDGADTLSGGSGDDKFGGGAGPDFIDGGVGSDTAFFRDKTLSVTVTLNGAKVVTARVDRSAEDSLCNVENLTGGSGNDSFTGDGLANILDGSTGNDTLDGRAGADTLIGGLGNDSFTVDNTADKVVEANGAGTDSVISSVSFSIATQFVENLLLTGSANIDATGNNLNNVITGNAGANTLDGSAGNDALDGKGGADTMIGGLGNDSFTVDNTADKVVEANGAGTDGVVSSVSFSIASQFVESLLLTGSDDIAAFGNNLDNVITGNAGANALTGYLGKDLFLFRAGLSTGNVDTIRDFRVSDDTIGLATNVFTQAHGLRADGTGTLLSGEFRANTTGLAQDGDDRIIYETDTGNVFYDANGSAAGGSFLFAKVGTGLALTNADFLLV